MKNKINIITITACALVIILLSVTFFVVPDKELSQKENRVLAQLPEFSISSLIKGEYIRNITEYISDQFPARDFFIAVKAYSELCLGKVENNGVVYGKNNTLIARDDITENRLQDNLQAIKEFETVTGVPVCTAILPRTIDVFGEYLPNTYPIRQNGDLWQEYYNTAKEKELVAPNLYDALCEGNNYYRTDHHYNTYGAYQTYVLLGDVLGYTPKESDFFQKEIVSENFCGTSMRTSGFYLTKKDEITLFRYDGDTKYNIVADGKDIEIYDMSRLNATDQYSVFLGGNHARIDINTDVKREKLLVIRDSFADSIAPFLALHYDLVMLDLRYYTDNIQQLVIDESVDRVLILESMSEFAVTKNISYLKRGVEK